jgi:hypothetical protein
MSPKKPENERGKKPFTFRPGTGGRKVDDRIIDASPGDRAEDQNDRAQGPAAPGKKQELQNLTDHKAWKQSTGAASRVWSRYIEILRTSFKNMSRERQMQLISNASQIICCGLTAVALSYFYRFFPLFARVALVPLLLVGAYWVGTHIVAEAMIERFNKYLNTEF